MLDLSRYTSPGEAYRLLVESLSVILEVHGDARVLEELGVKALVDLDKAVRDAAALKGGSTPRGLYEVSNLIEGRRRKVLAAYYTDPLGVRVISALAKSYALDSGFEDVVVADPFMGSGVLLAGFIKEFGCEKVGRVIGFEKDPLACLVGYAALLRLCGRGKVEVKCGDTFEIVRLQPTLAGSTASYKSCAHLILTNPPFTRWELLDSKYRRLLESRFTATHYSKYIARRQLNLQTLSLFTADYMLRKGGLLAAVLPASTFYTIYGEGVKKLLRENYRILALIQKRGESSFSLGSGFKEVVLVASKSREGRGETAFVTLDSGLEPSLAYSSGWVRAPGAEYVDLHSVPPILDFNWLSLFNLGALKPLVSALSTLTSAGRLLPLAEAIGEDGVIRGVEMYGPDFFLVPNKYWRVAGVSGDSIAISGGGEVLELPREYAVKSLRKPGLYTDRILVDPDHYLVSIPPVSVEELPSGVRRYVAWGLKSGAAAAAVRAFGEKWYSHVYRQVESKKPFAKLFLPDKVDARFRNRGVFAVASEAPASATKDFYLVLDEQCSPLLTLWFNSSLFISLLLYAGRAISEAWTRFLEEDYLRLPAPSPGTCREYREESEKLIREISAARLPPLPLQLDDPRRRRLDEFILDTLGVQGVGVDYLHELLAKPLKEHAIRGKQGG
ncbi:hypothetical protein WLZ34_01535 [Thermogladius sp. KZ2Tp1]|uniref:N-6 DNA methylase n=1 Tax=Thermogladius sp. KZ2Tp1 TaxID=3136289 RepID=UPI003DA98BCE